MAGADEIKRRVESRITRPSQRKTGRKPRILVYSRNKKGKTRFCTTAPNVLVIDPEEGTEYETKADPNTYKVSRWEDMDDLYRYARSGDHPYEWFAFDGMTKICNMALRYILSLKEERQLDTKPSVAINIKYHGSAGELVKGMLHNFHMMGQYGLVLTAQERMVDAVTGDDEDEDAESPGAMFVPDLPKGVRGAANSMVDVIGRLYVVKADVKVKVGDQVETRQRMQRRLWLEPSAQYDTGYRSQFVLPNHLKNPTVPRLVQLLKEGKNTSG